MYLYAFATPGRLGGAGIHTLQISIGRIKVRKRDDAGHDVRSGPDLADALNKMVLAQAPGDASRQAPA